jgi:predicted AlkP superfamily pyrophosphatase or phosphodiesterase
MFRLLAAVIAALFVVAHPSAQSPVRLVVVVVLDQFRADYLTTFASHWRDGFRTLLNEGAVFTRAAYPYQHTDTCAGHFTIGTGAFPRTHGMVSDLWWDPESRRNIECTDDDQSPLVTYGRPSKLGKSARRSMVPSLADELRSQKPGARVVSLSLKARSAIGLAGHGGDAITWFEESVGVGSFVTARAFSADPVPAVRAFLTRDSFEKDFGKVWTLRDPRETYRNADAGIGERPRRPWTGLFPHEIKGTTDSRDDAVALWRASPFSDAYLGRMALDLIDAFSLGTRTGTDFLGVGFSSTDSVGHPFGPASRELEDTVARQDDVLGTLIRKLDQKVGRERYVLAVSADHGVSDVPVTRGAGRIASEDIRERIEEILINRFGPPPAKTRYIVAASDFIRFADGIFDRVRNDPALLTAIERAVTAIPGVDRVLRKDTLSDRSSDPIVRAAALTKFEGRSGDLIIVPKPNWPLGGRAVAEAGSHGAPYDYDQRVPVILFGAGVKAGRYERAATPADIAPTLARVAGIRMTKAEGRVLTEALGADLPSNDATAAPGARSTR